MRGGLERSASWCGSRCAPRFVFSGVGVEREEEDDAHARVLGSALGGRRRGVCRRPRATSRDQSAITNMGEFSARALGSSLFKTKEQN